MKHYLFFLRNMISVAILMIFSVSVMAKTHIIEMRNADAADTNTLNVFSPGILRINKGDTVRFVMVDKGHNSASKKGMLPKGAQAWSGAIDEKLEITFDVEGTYGYLCSPHYQMGMVGLILVGDYTSNYDAAKKVRHAGKARKVFRQLFKYVEQCQ